jgi:hypothetical protein
MKMNFALVVPCPTLGPRTARGLDLHAGCTRQGRTSIAIARASTSSMPSRPIIGSPRTRLDSFWRKGLPKKKSLMWRWPRRMCTLSSCTRCQFGQPRPMLMQAAPLEAPAERVAHQSPVTQRSQSTTRAHSAAK